MTVPCIMERLTRDALYLLETQLLVFGMIFSAAGDLAHGLGVGMAAGPAGLSRIGSELSLQHGCVIKL